jgi:hypothetical protein
MWRDKSTPEIPRLMSDEGTEYHQISASKRDGEITLFASRIPKYPSGRCDNLYVKATPEELLTFTRDLAEMQGYALVVKEPEHWVPLGEGCYVRDKSFPNPAVAWFPTEEEARNHNKQLGGYPFTWGYMQTLQDWCDLTPEDFAPLRKLYYQKNPNP